MKNSYIRKTKHMRNIFLKQFEYANVSDFTSDACLKIRKAINPLWRAILKQYIFRKVYIESYPKLDRKSVPVCGKSFL